MFDALWLHPIEEGVLSARGEVDEILDQLEITRLERRIDAADDIDCDHIREVEILERLDVCAVVDPLRRNAVITAMTGQERDLYTVPSSSSDLRGAEFVGDLLAGTSLKGREVVEAGAGDDSDHLRSYYSLSPAMRRPM